MRSNRIRRSAKRVSAVVLVVVAAMVLSGCGVVFPPAETTSTTKVQLEVWFVGADENTLSDLGITLNERLLVESWTSTPTGGSAELSTTLLAPPNITGGAEGTKTLVPKDVRIGDFLPVAVPFQAGFAAKDFLQNQVMISVRLIEASLDNLNELGVDRQLSDLDNLPSGQIVGLGITPSVFSLRGSFLDDFQLQDILNSLKLDQQATIFASPKAITLNNQQAVFMAENEIGFVTDLEFDVKQAVQSVDPQVTMIDTGMVLDVTPEIMAGGRSVRLQLHPGTTMVQVQKSQPFDDADGLGHVIRIPVLQLSQVRTVVTIPDGRTLLLGGMTVTEDDVVCGQLPCPDDQPVVESLVALFGKIPLINRPFRNDALIRDERTLLILVKPTIITQD